MRGTGKLKAEVETALWELVAGGLLTADGFDNLRALIDPKRRSGQGNGRSARPATQCRAMVFAVCGRIGGTQPGAGSDVLDAAAALRDCVSRGAEPGDHPAEVARGADYA